MITPDNYYEDIKHISNSMLGRLLENVELFTKWMNGEYLYPATAAMNQGTLVHHHWLDDISGGALKGVQTDIHIIDNFNGRTNVGKAYKAEMIAKYPLLNFITEDENAQVERMVNALISDKFTRDYINKLKSEYAMLVEQAYVKEIDFYDHYTGESFKISIKGLVDISFFDIDGNRKKIVDLKTTRGHKNFRKSVWDYRYNGQAKHYTELTGLNLEDNVFDFLTISKDNMDIKVYETDSESFISGANQVFHFGLASYLKWKNKDFNAFRFEKL